MSATAALVLAALGGFALAAVTAMLGPGRLREPTHRAGYLTMTAAAVALAVAGFLAVLGHPGSLGLGAVEGFGNLGLHMDRLSGLFLALTGVVTAPVTLGFAAWTRGREAPLRPLPAIVALTLAGIVVVLTATSAFVFLFGWESVSVSFFLLSGYRRDRAATTRAAMVTLGFSKASGALLLLAFALLYATTGSFAFTAWTHASGTAHASAYALVLAAFAVKVGLVPVQVWLPPGYAAAPGPARALMSAVAANVGFYGMWRFYGLLGRPPTWLAVVLLLAAAATGILGIAHAAVQRDLQRVIAYSSVENAGLITGGFAVALAGAATGLTPLVAAGLLASGLQMITHALAKSSLFLASGRIEQTTGATDLDEMLGRGSHEPLVGAAFCAGALTLAALPLTVGFVSEWFLLESVMQLFRVGPMVLKLSLAITGATLALTAGYAAFTFVRLVGLVVLGPSRAREPRAPAGQPALGVLGRVALIVPSVCCVGVAVVTPWEVRLLADGLMPLVGHATTLSALNSPWVLQPVYAGFSALSPSWLAVELPVLALAVLTLGAVASRGSLLRVRRVAAWRSASGEVLGDGRYTAFAFANPTRHVLGNLLLTRSGHAELAARQEALDRAASVMTGPGAAASDPVLAAEPDGDEGPGVYTTDVVELVGAFLYRPLLRPLRRLVAGAKRLQNGRLDAYLSYMLIALVALIAVVVGFT